MFKIVIMDLCDKVLVVGGATGVASGRSWEKLPPCLLKTVTDGSKTDLPLVKDKPVSNSGSASMITYLSREKSPCSKAVVERQK